MLDTSKRTIATLTAAACLGAGGWAMAASTSGTAPTTTPAQTPSTQIQSEQSAAPTGAPCDEDGAGQGGSGESGTTGSGSTTTESAPATTPDTSSDQEVAI